MTLLLQLLLTTLVSGPPLQAPAETSFYAVAYVEITPSAKPMVVAAFKQYRDASRKDEGFGRFELFEQVGRPGHLAIIETFSNQKAFDAHQAAAQTKEWRSKMDAIRLSDYDQRPYKALNIGSGSVPGNDRLIYVVSHVDIGGQGTNAADLLRRLAETSRKDEGNLRFDVLQHAMRANHFTVIETWQSQKALDAHAAASHTRQYRDGLAPISGSPLDERLYKAVE
jgi:quinol monooxygenase YgiN